MLWTEIPIESVPRVTMLPLFENGIDNDPNWDGIHRGSAYQGSVYSQVQKDLRRVVGAKKIRGR